MNIYNMDDYYNNLSKWLDLKRKYDKGRKRCLICSKNVPMTFKQTKDEYDASCDAGCSFRLKKPLYGTFKQYLYNLKYQLRDIIIQIEQLKLDYVYERIDVETLNHEFEPLKNKYEQIFLWISVLEKKYLKQSQIYEIKETYNKSQELIQSYVHNIRESIQEKKYNEASLIFKDRVLEMFNQIYECYSYQLIEKENKNQYHYKKQWKYDTIQRGLFLLNSQDDLPRVIEFKKSS